METGYKFPGIPVAGIGLFMIGGGLWLRSHDQEPESQDDSTQDIDCEIDQTG